MIFTEWMSATLGGRHHKYSAAKMEGWEEEGTDPLPSLAAHYTATIEFMAIGAAR